MKNQEVWKREIGAVSTRKFARRLAASQDFVLRLDIHQKLAMHQHRERVKTISFNACGDLLVSGSVGGKITLWNWDTHQANYSFDSGRNERVSQVNIVPYTEDRTIISLASGGKGGGVQQRWLSSGDHGFRPNKYAIVPGSPHQMYACGDAGRVWHVDMRLKPDSIVFALPLIEVPSHGSLILREIAIDPGNIEIFAVGGSDEFVRLFDVRQSNRPFEMFCPDHLIDDGDVGITGVAFSRQRELLVSYNEEFIYLFPRDKGPNANREESPQVYRGHRNCDFEPGLGFFGPNSDYVVSGSDCGRIFIWKKGGELVRVLPAGRVVNCVVSHPHSPVLASCVWGDIIIWTPKAIDIPPLPSNIQEQRPSSTILSPFSHGRLVEQLSQQRSSMVYGEETEDSDSAEESEEDSDVSI